MFCGSSSWCRGLVGLQCVIVVFPDHTHLLFVLFCKLLMLMALMILLSGQFYVQLRDTLFCSANLIAKC